MANVISNAPGEDETDKPGQQNNNQPGQAVQNPSQAPTITSSQANTPNANQKGSGYTNISKVLQANQGNQLGSTVGNNIQQVGNQVQDNLRNAQNQFQQQSQQNQFNTDQNKQLVQNVLQDPTQYTTQDQHNPNSQQGRQFQTLISGNYQGPQNLNNADQIQNQAANTAQMGQALGTAGGRIGVLQQVVGNPQYTRGQQNLDNLLLGQSNDPAIQAAKRQALMLQGKTNSALAGAQAQGQQSSSEAQQFGNNVQNQLGQTVTAKDKALQDLATKANSDKDTQYRKMLSDLKSGNVTQQEADLLGVTQGQNVLDLLHDPSKFVNKSALNANVSNIASSDDYARLNALKQLSGQFAPSGAQSAFANYQDPTQAGKFQADQAITGNKDAFSKQLNSEMQNYNSILNPAENAVHDSDEILRLNAGQITPQERAQLESQNPNYQYAGDRALASILMQQRYPGAVTNGVTEAGWSISNSNTAKQNYQNALAQLQAKYGTPQKIHIQPSDLEKMPKVKG